MAQLIKHYYFIATTSAATIFLFFVLAFLEVRRIRTSVKPTALNSSWKAPLSLAPAIQENQSSSLQTCFDFTGSVNTISAA